MKDIITHPIFLWIFFGLIVSGLIMWTLTYIIASYCVYKKTLSRVSKELWSRDIPSSLDEQSLKMYEIGRKWHEANVQYKTDVHIVSEGLNLYGEYYDFEIPDVCGSFLHDNNMVPDDEPKPKPKKNLEEWAEELLEYYNCSASNQLKICICAEQMADFLEAFLNKEQ